jgi:hypothetical protein
MTLFDQIGQILARTPNLGVFQKTPISGKLPFWGQKSDTFSAFRVLVTTWQMSDLGQNLEKPGNH